MSEKTIDDDLDGLWDILARDENITTSTNTFPMIPSSMQFDPILQRMQSYSQSKLPTMQFPPNLPSGMYTSMPNYQQPCFEPQQLQASNNLYHLPIPPPTQFSTEGFLPKSSQQMFTGSLVNNSAGPSSTAPLTTYDTAEEDSDSDDDDDEEEVVDTTGANPINENLLVASEEGNVGKMRQILNENPFLDLDYRDVGDGGTALLWACKYGQLQAVSFLVDRGADTEIPDRFRWTPVMYACRYGHISIAKYLIQNGANVESTNQDGRLPLMWACNGGHLSIVKLLVESGANVESKDVDGYTALMWAVRNGYNDIVNYLLDQGADLNGVNNTGKTPLSCGAEAGRTDVVTNLFNRGADIDHEDNDGWTPLIEAAYHARTNTMNFLMARGADLKAITRIKTDRGNNMEAVRWALDWNGDHGFLW